MIRRKISVGVAASALLLTPAHHLQAQATYAAVHGTATDVSGAVLPDATVTILNTSTGISASARTDEKGYYIFPQLAIGGPYTTTISKVGFSDFRSSGLMLNLNDNREIDAQMQAGTEAQNINVQASAVQVDTSDTQLKQTISSKEILDLPLLGRNAITLQKLSPGVVEASDGRGGFATNGNQSFSNSYMLDGADINDGPLNTAGVILNPDAMAQENIITGTASAQYARNSGATVDQTVKSGTNTFHGDAFEFYRDTFLNDPGYKFGAKTARAPFHQNTYGGIIGGPVIKSKVFFFLGYQGIRNRTATSSFTPVFTPAQLGGNFSGDGSTVSSNPVPFSVGSCVVPSGGVGGNPANNPTWAQCLPGLSVNPATFNSVSSRLLTKYVPAVNNTIRGIPGYSFNPSNTEGYDQGTIRLDYQLTPSDTLWGSSVFQSSPTTETLPFTGASLPGFTEVDSEHIKLFNASYTHIFSPTMLNEIRVNYFRFIYAAVSPQQVQLPSSAGFQNINPQDAASASLPTISLNGYFTLGFSNNGPQPRNDQNLGFSETLTKVLGNHNLSFGAFAQKFTVENPFYFNNNGNFAFNGSGAYSSGDPALDFALGIPDSYSQSSGGFIDARAWEGYAFTSDNWKASKGLTLNIALGYDIETPYEALQYNQEGIICYQNGTATSKIFPSGPPGLLYPGDPGCNNMGGATIKYDHLSPRVGFAWTPNASSNLLTGAEGTSAFSVRGGFGVYYNRDIEEEALQNLGDPPFTKSSLGIGDSGPYTPSFTNPYADVAGQAVAPSPFPFTAPAAGASVPWGNFVPLDINTVSPRYSVPYVYSFNLNVERSLPSNMVAFIGYSGSLGHNLALTGEADPITQAGHDACLASTACQTGRGAQSLFYPSHKLQPAVYLGSTTPYYLSVGQEATTGASNYNGLLLSLTKAPTHGLFFQLSYTFSHGLDNGSGYESSSGSQGRSINFVPGYQYLNYGDSDYDARHHFTAAYDYTVPLPHILNNHFASREAFGGWTVAGVTALQTGFPVNVYQSGYRSLYCDEFTFYGCPDAPNTSAFHISGSDPRKAPWFNKALFSSEAIGSFGNTKRNYFHGPGFNYTNLNIAKNFKIDPDGVRYVQLRLESYNAFNHANFANPANNFSNGSFGVITATRGPVPLATGDPQPGRAVQLAAKFYF